MNTVYYLLSFVLISAENQVDLDPKSHDWGRLKESKGTFISIVLQLLSRSCCCLFSSANSRLEKDSHERFKDMLRLYPNDHAIIPFQLFNFVLGLSEFQCNIAQLLFDILKVRFQFTTHVLMKKKDRNLERGSETELKRSFVAEQT